ncbi:MAG: CPBP family glutamic-type intramembrane protease [Caldilineaceae bacterium]
MTVRYLLFVCLTLFLTAFLGYGTYNTAKLLRTWTPDRNLLLLPGETIVRLILIGVCIGLGILSGWPRRRSGGRPTIWTGRFCGAWAGAWSWPASSPSPRAWLTAATGRRFYSDTVIQHIVPHDADELLWVTLAMVPVVVLEELLFRSLLLGGLTRCSRRGCSWWGRPFCSARCTVPRVRGALGASLAGMVFGLLFFRRGASSCRRSPTT